MQSTENTFIRRGSHTDKWLTLDVMQRVEQVRCIAEMLDATMEDISDQMENLGTVMEYLQEGAETIQDRIEELMGLIQEEVENRNEMIPAIHDDNNLR